MNKIRLLFRIKFILICLLMSAIVEWCWWGRKEEEEGTGGYILLLVGREGGGDLVPLLPFILLVFAVLLGHCLLYDPSSPYPRWTHIQFKWLFLFYWYRTVLNSLRGQAFGLSSLLLLLLLLLNLIIHSINQSNWSSTFLVPMELGHNDHYNCPRRQDEQ